MATILASPALPTPDDPRHVLEDLYERIRELHPKDRVEIINDRVVVSPVPSRVHELILFELMHLLMRVARKRGWFFSGTTSVFLGAQRDRYRPDLTVMPRDAPMWGVDHVYGNATVLVVEIVSESSKKDDHRVKPQSYAAGGVPLCMVIDCFRNTVRLLSKPNTQQERYEVQEEVSIGKPIELPAPWNLTLNTGELTG